MSTLVIPDVHQNHKRAQAIIDRAGAGRHIVFTGDFFDSYGDDPFQAHETAVWLKEQILPNPNITVLIGNHDVSYLWNLNPNYWCSGFTKEKSASINAVLTPEDKAKFKLFHISEGFVFSHAGLTNKLWKTMVQRYTDDAPSPTTLDFFAEVLGAYAKEAVKDSDAGHAHFLLSAGWDRGGRQQHGGITWVDWNSFAPINGINQIVGHSRRRVPAILVQREGGSISNKSIIEHYEHQALIAKANEYSNARGGVPLKQKHLSVSYNLDTGLNHYAIVSNGSVEIFDYINDINLRDVQKYAIPENPLNNLS